MYNNSSLKMPGLGALEHKFSPKNWFRHILSIFSTLVRLVLVSLISLWAVDYYQQPFRNRGIRTLQIPRGIMKPWIPKFNSKLP